MRKNINVLLIIIFTFLSLFVLDFFSRFMLYESISFVDISFVSPYIFSLFYILIIFFILFINKKLGKIIYIIFTSFFNIYTLAQILHYMILDRTFTFTDLFVANQATGYLGYIINMINPMIILMNALSIIFLFISIFIINKTTIVYGKKKKIRIGLLFVLLIVLIRILGILSLGNGVEDDSWNFWSTPLNVYNTYDNPSRSYIISGIYEYAFRDLYVYIRDRFIQDDTNDIEVINDYINSKDIALIEKNDYTDIFLGKNLIMIMMESIDSWLINDEVMPTLSYLKNNGIDFVNRYSPSFGGGMTINSEFASLTGLYAVITNKPIYFYDDNDYSYSLPSLFKDNGYIVNSVHMNSGAFYNRKNFHRSLGFDNHYALNDIIEGVNFQYDTNLIKNDTSYGYIINKDNKFMTFITTYSAHVPYVNNKLCDSLDTSKFMVENDDETTCLRTLANETDNFIKLLIERLEDDNLLDDTVIVLFSDHYAYGYSNTSKWTNIFDTKLSQHTNYTIWNKNVESKKIDIYTHTVDIPVTLFNMFGIKYNPNIYMGSDVFSNYHDNFVYFNDYSWLSNEIYFNGDVRNIKDISYVKDVSSMVNKKIRINEKIISSDFYRYYNK